MKTTRVRILAGCVLLLLVLVFSLPASGAIPKASQAASPVYLPMAQNNHNVDEAPPTSIGLIDQDREAGILDAYTAGLYKLFTLIPDSPLPAKYVGAPDENADIAILRDILGMYDTLTTEQKAQVDPYLRRPDDPTSALFQFQQRQPAEQAASGSMASATRPPSDIDWGSVTGTKGVVVHYRKDIAGDLTKANGVSDAIDATIYTGLSTLMNAHMWMNDSGCTAGGVAANGGTDALDVYLIHGIADRGVEYSCWGINPTPGWVVLNADRDIGDATHIGMVQTASHEMFHAIQDNYTYKYAVGSYLWMQEATAKWVEDYVYHNAQSEHDYAQLYLDEPWVPMDYIPAGSIRYYGEYLWPFYLTRVLGRPVSIIRTMFEQAASYNSVEVFMQKAGSDTPVLNFGNFAVRNWNDAPATEYQTADSLTKKVKQQVSETISGVTAKKVYELKPQYADFARLSAIYYHYTFSDNTARTVAFYNGIESKVTEAAGNINFLDTASIFYQTEYLGLAAYDGMEVHALLKINNVWTEEDWTDESYRIFCRDRKSQRLQELVLIITNGNFKDSQANFRFKPAGLNPTLQVSPTGCYQWSGTFSMADTSDPGIIHTVTGNAVFEADPDIFPPDVFFNLKSGGATLTMTGESSDHINRFNVGASANFPSSDPSSYNYLGTYNLVTGGPHPNAYYGNGQTNATVPGTSWWCCDEDENWVEEQGNFAIGRWFMTPNPVNNQWISQSSGNIIDGNYTTPDGHETYTWHFVAVSEP
jgi:hypothetical protein